MGLKNCKIPRNCTDDYCTGGVEECSTVAWVAYALRRWCDAISQISNGTD